MRGKVCAVLTACTMLLLLLITCMNLRTVQAEVLGFENNLTNDTQEQRDPAIWGDRIVWNELISGIRHIILYDLSMDSDEDGTPNYLEDERPEPDPAKIRITFNASHKYNPDIHGDTIVWEDNRHGNSDIYMYDLTEDTDGDNIPNYLDDDDDNDGTLDLEDSDPDPAEIRITDNPSHQEKPEVYGSKIIWTDLRYGNRDIYIYDMISGKEAIVAGYQEEGTDIGDKIVFPSQRNPEIYRDTVVWEDNRHGKMQIFMYNLSLDSDSDGIPNFLDDDRPNPDPAEFRVTNNTESDFEPSIFHNHIVYTRLDDVYLYDIQTQIEYKLTDSTSGQNIELQMCNIHGTKIVFSYGSDDQYYIYLYDLSEDTDDDGIPNFRDPDRPSPDPALNNITDVPLTFAQPVIYTNKIAWQDDRNTSSPPYDIYLFTMTENLPPEITFSAPDPVPEIEESQWQGFNITASDPDDDALIYLWYVDGEPVLGESTEYYNYTTDHDSAGLHEVFVVVSDGEYFVENIWYIQVTESGVEVLEITDYEPKFDPVLNETEEITFSITYSYLGSGEPSVHWHVQDGIQEPRLTIQEDGLSTIIEAPFDSNESDTVYNVDITVWITDGFHNVSHTWHLTVNYFNDIDEDGYNDSTEVEWSSDPLNDTSTPPDLDGDYIVDGEDDDIDGDGHLNKDDAYPLDPDRHEREDDGNTIWIIIIVLIIVVVLVILLTLPKIRKS